MSLAWSTIAIITLLLPGFLFYVGIQIPERFARERIKQRTLSQLAGSVFVALTVHGLLLLFLQTFGTCESTDSTLRCVDLRASLELLSVPSAAEFSTNRDLAGILARDAKWIGAYFLVASLAGLVGGGLAGRSMAYGGILRVITRHRWAHSLVVRHPLRHRIWQEVKGACQRTARWLPVLVLKYVWSRCIAALAGWFRSGPRRRNIFAALLRGRRGLRDSKPMDAVKTVLNYLALVVGEGPARRKDFHFFANVVTRIKSKRNVLVYRGRISDYGLTETGCLSYVALREPARCYMRLGDEEAAIDHDWHVIGSSEVGEERDDGYPTRGDQLFVVDGEDIEHIVFSGYPLESTKEGRQRVENIAAIMGRFPIKGATKSLGQQELNLK